MLAEKLRSANSVTSRIGSEALSSRMTNAVSASAEKPSRPRTVPEPHGYTEPPQFSASSSGTRPAVSAAAPHQSTRCCCPGSGRGMATASTDEGHDADRDVDVEDPAPAERVGEPAAERGSKHGGESEHRTHEALVAGALPRLEQVTDDRHTVRHHGAAADALDASEQDELEHLLRSAGRRREDGVEPRLACGPGERGSREEERDAAQVEPLAAVEVRQLADDRDSDGRGERVDGEHPRQQRHSAKLADDVGHGGADDGGVERSEQHRQEHARQDGEFAAVGQIAHVHIDGVLSGSVDSLSARTR